MNPRRRAAIFRCLALASTSAAGTVVQAAANETSAEVAVSARRYEQSVRDVPGVSSSHAELGVLQGALRRKAQIQDFSLGLEGAVEGGRSGSGETRYAGGTLTPSIAYEGQRQTHRFAASYARFYDSQGMARTTLREQLDAQALTDDQKNRYTQAGLATDHWVSVSPRHALVVFASAARLDREIVTRTYVGGGFFEREMAPLWKLRLGGGALRVIYDGEEIRASGPEIQSLHEWSETWKLTLKAGSKTFRSEDGTSEAQTGGVALEYKRGEDNGTLAYERATGNKPVTAEITTSDVSSAKGRVAVGAATGIEGNVEQRLERWLQGEDEGARADSLTTGLTFVVGWGGRVFGRDDRSRFDVLVGFQREELRLKTGSKATRQVASAGLARVF